MRTLPKVVSKSWFQIPFQKHITILRFKKHAITSTNSYALRTPLSLSKGLNYRHRSKKMWQIDETVDNVYCSLPHTHRQVWYYGSINGRIEWCIHLKSNFHGQELTLFARRQAAQYCDTVDVICRPKKQSPLDVFVSWKIANPCFFWIKERKETKEESWPILMGVGQSNTRF